MLYNAFVNLVVIECIHADVNTLVSDQDSESEPSHELEQ